MFRRIAQPIATGALLMLLAGFGAGTAQAAVPGWAERGKPTFPTSQVAADRTFASADCAPNSALLFRMRGSDEDYGSDQLGAWAFRAGGELIRKGWRVRDMQAIYSAPKVPIVDVGKRLAAHRILVLGLTDAAFFMKRYRDVASREAPAVVRQLQDAYARCPERTIVVAGYSQGALLARIVYPKLSVAARKRIVAVDLVADPTADQRADVLPPGAPTGSPLWARRTGRGLDTFANSGNPVFKQRPYRESSGTARVTQYCLPYDLVCEVNAVNAPRFAANQDVHHSYEFGGIGAATARRLRSHPVAPSSSPTGPVSGDGESAEAVPEDGAPAAPVPAATYAAQQGSRGVNTFANPYNASGMGSRIPAATWVDVACKVYAPAIVSANPDGYWYRLASAPWTGLYSPANTFMNGDPWGGPYSRNTDWAIPDCV